MWPYQIFDKESRRSIIAREISLPHLSKIPSRLPENSRYSSYPEGIETATENETRISYIILKYVLFLMHSLGSKIRLAKIIKGLAQK